MKTTFLCLAVLVILLPIAAQHGSILLDDHDTLLISCTGPGTTHCSLAPGKTLDDVARHFVHEREEFDAAQAYEAAVEKKLREDCKVK